MIHDESTITHFRRSLFFVLLGGPPFFVGKKLRFQIQYGASLCQARLSQCFLNQPYATSLVFLALLWKVSIVQRSLQPLSNLKREH